MNSYEDSFTLFDLHITIVKTARPFVCSHIEGGSFTVTGENLCFTEGGTFSLYALAALLPLIPAKQRPLSPHDWMSTDELVACPDPNCGAQFRITRSAPRTFRHSETTVVPLARNTI